MIKQLANTVLMVRPAAFGFNEQTAIDNHYQRRLDHLSPSQINALAVAEFDRMVANLRSHRINVVVIEDTPEPVTTDAIFPNNWVSFHADGTVVLYPMCAPIRRLERRDDVLATLREQHGFDPAEVIDLSSHENDQRYLEGTGAIIFDHPARLAYMAVSPRAERALFEQFCQRIDYQPVAFESFQSVGDKRLPIYHTNVMMSIADRFAVICTEAIDDLTQRAMVLASLRDSGKQLIEISEAQTAQFAGNVLQVGDADGQAHLVMSSTAFAAFSPSQKQTIEQHCPIIHSPIPTIETLGGGSARCMMAEVFLPQGKQ